ncbi:MAG: DUF123 domain-containing protein [Candidatus Thorarchaeota archaeon]
MNPAGVNAEMRGVYALIVHLRRDVKILLESGRAFEFTSGYWIYIGSAQGLGSTNLENRLRRHFRKKKKIHWHIDHLLSDEISSKEAIWAESNGKKECILIRSLADVGPFQWGPRGFGSSDCQESCSTHVLRYVGEKNPIRNVENGFRQIGLTPRRYSIETPK